MKVLVCFPGGQNIYKLGNSDVVTFFVKTNVGRDRRFDFAFYCNVSYVLAESLEHEGSISSSSFYEKLAFYYLMVSMCVQSALLGNKLKFLRLHLAVLIIRSQLGSKRDYPTTMFS